MTTIQTLWPDDGCVERVIMLFEGVSEAKCTGYTRVNDMLLIHMAYPEPGYKCNDDCWLYGREDESDDFFPCSHCYVVGRK